jgi:uncharacterized protein YjbI with pentapeptide repeats
MKHCALLSCGRPALADPQAQGYCILHAPWDGKDLSAFQAAIDEIIKEAREGSGTCDFWHCYFPPSYDCQNLEEAFKFNCDFMETKFSGYANFMRAVFSGYADFMEAEFYEYADFTEAEFPVHAHFVKAKFSRGAGFVRAQFFRSADFSEAEFSRYAGFIQAKFSGDANFGGAKFSGYANFQGAEFSEGASFSEAKFYGNAYFGGTKFFGEIDFNTAEFRQLADFSKVETAKNATVHFQGVKLLKPQQVFFHHVDLSRWSFLDTDLRRIDFNDVTWGTIRRLLSRRTALFDELNVSNQKDDLAKVERLYRHLKQNYESQRDYGRAGDFYYGEMEMKRRQLNPLGQIPFWIYRILSGYGESYPRALFWLIVMWLLFAVLFTVVGYTDEWGNHADLWRSLIYSAQSMTLFHEPKITFDNTLGQAVKLVASVLGVIQIALFGLALQRRFKR